MKLMKLKSPFWSLFVVALLVGLPFLCSEAQARGGGGFSGGSFRGGGGYAAGPRGGAVAVGPAEERLLKVPGGSCRKRAVRRRRVRGPEDRTAYRPGRHYGPGYRGPVLWRRCRRLAVGTVVGTLPARPQPCQWRVKDTTMTAPPITSHAIRVLTSITAWSRIPTSRDIAGGLSDIV